MSTNLRRRRVVAALVAFLAVGTVMGTSATATPAEPEMTVDKVMVNKLGGVSVVGSISCAGFASQVRENGMSYMDGDDQWQYLPPVGPDVLLNIAANSDNYTVSQPAGRRLMIAVTHASSRMTPCYVEYPEGFGDNEPPCTESGTSCTWVTDHMSYEGTTPLFDYSSDGKFKVGTLAVAAESVGTLLDVYTVDENGAVTDFDTYYAPDGRYAYTSTTLRAVKYP